MAIRLTVVLLSYLRTTYLDEALDSVLEQDTANGFEILFVTASEGYQPPVALSKKAAEKGISLRRVQIGRVPVGEGLARALEVSTGDVVAIIDDDDTWAPGKLRAVERAFEADPQLLYFHNGQTFINSKGRPLGASSTHRLVRHRGSLAKEGSRLTSDTRDLPGMRTMQRLEPDFNNSSIAIKRAVLERSKGALRQVAAGEDSFLFLCALAGVGHVSCCSDRLTMYRIHASTLTYPPVTFGSSLERLDALRGYVHRHLGEVTLAMEAIGSDPYPPARNFLKRDTAYWVLMDSVLSGNPSTNRVSTQIRNLLASDGLALRLRDGAAIFLAALTIIVPNSGRGLLAAWRMTW